MNNQQIGTTLCLTVVLVPFILGWMSGMWFQRRINKFGMPGALIPNFVKRILEDRQWK